MISLTIQFILQVEYSMQTVKKLSKLPNLKFLCIDLAIIFYNEKV